MDRDLHYVFDILESANVIQAHIAGVSYRQFLADLRLQDSVIRRIQIMGEAVGRLSPEFRDEHPEIPWSRIRGMRNRLVHVYDDVELKRVWEAATLHVPRLMPQLKSMLPPAAE